MKDVVARGRYAKSRTLPSSAGEGDYAVIYQKRMLQIWDAIRELPSKDRPGYVRFLMDLCLAHLDWNTGLVGLSREELAERMKVPARRVTEAAAVLERLGALTREPVMFGQRKSIYVQYRVPPDVAGKGLRPPRMQAKEAPASNVVALRAG